MHGIVDKAPNAEAAGYFIRYWLDNDNYDIYNTFISDSAQSFYVELANASSDKKLYITDPSVAKLVSMCDVDYYWDRFEKGDASAIVDDAVEKANKAMQEYSNTIKDSNNSIDKQNVKFNCFLNKRKNKLKFRRFISRM